MVSSHKRLELSLLTALVATQRYQPVWFLLMSVMLMRLLLPWATTVMLPLWVSCCHTYWIGPVPFSRLHRIHIVEPSTGDTSLSNRYGLLTGTAFKKNTERNKSFMLIIIFIMLCFRSAWLNHSMDSDSFVCIPALRLLVNWMTVDSVDYKNNGQTCFGLKP